MGTHVANAMQLVAFTQSHKAKRMKLLCKVFSIVVITLLVPMSSQAQSTVPPAIELSEPPPPLPLKPERGDDITPEHSHSHDGHSHERETGPHGGRIVRLEHGVAVELVYDPLSRSVTVFLPRNDRREIRDGLPLTPNLSRSLPHCDGGSCQLPHDERTGRRLGSYLERGSIYDVPPRLHLRSPSCPFDRFEPDRYFHP